MSKLTPAELRRVRVLIADVPDPIAHCEHGKTEGHAVHPDEGDYTWCEGPDLVAVHVPCPNCNGTGRRIRPDDPNRLTVTCGRCSGRGQLLDDGARPASLPQCEHGEIEPHTDPDKPGLLCLGPTGTAHTVREVGRLCFCTDQNHHASHVGGPQPYVETIEQKTPTYRGGIYPFSGAEYLQSALILLKNHAYVPDPQSGAGNCLCGAAELHRRHPHQAEPAVVGSGNCRCGLTRSDPRHGPQPANPANPV